MALCWGVVVVVIPLERSSETTWSGSDRLDPWTRMGRAALGLRRAEAENGEPTPHAPGACLNAKCAQIRNGWRCFPLRMANFRSTQLGALGSRSALSLAKTAMFEALVSRVLARAFWQCAIERG